MRLRSLVLLALVPSLPAPLAGAQGRVPFPAPETRLFVAATDGGPGAAGSLLEVEGGPPWSVSTLAPTGGGRRLRAFGRWIYAVDEAAGTVTRVDRAGGRRRTYDLGPGSEPQDVLAIGGALYVTLRTDPGLRRVALGTGQVRVAVDLSLVAEPGEAVQLGTVERDGGRLLVQVRLDAALGRSRGVLAVVDLAHEVLVDVEPDEPGVQGVALQGAPPQAKMQIGPRPRTLFVSTTGERLDSRGGIEMVDLDALRSVGFALTEEQIGGADLGGFVMTSRDGGYFVFHTDIVASTHLKPFTVSGGVPPGPEMLTLLGDAVEVIAHDPVRGRIYVPSGFAAFGAVPAVHVFDTATNEPAGPPIATPQRAHDVLVGR